MKKFLSAVVILVLVSSSADARRRGGSSYGVPMYGPGGYAEEYRSRTSYSRSEYGGGYGGYSEGGYRSERVGREQSFNLRPLYIDEAAVRRAACEGRAIEIRDTIILCFSDGTELAYGAGAGCCPGGCYPERCPRTILYGNRRGGKSKYHYMTGDMVEWCGHKQVLGACHQCGVWTYKQGMVASAIIGGVANLGAAFLLRSGMRITNTAVASSRATAVSGNSPPVVVPSGQPFPPIGDGPFGPQ